MNALARLMISALAATSVSRPAAACPVYLPANELPPAVGGARKDLRLFALPLSAGGRRWVTLPLQVDALDGQGVLLEGDGDGRSGAAPLAPSDRLTLRREDFGAKLTPADAAPCRTDSVVELATLTPPLAFAYLARCDGPPPLAAPAVAHDAAAHRLNAARYAYEYQPNNQLLFKTMVAKGPWGAPLPAGSDADLALHFDVRNFLTLDLTNKDVENYVNNTASGPVGVVGSIDFFLRILFFKVDLKMATTAGFYADSAHIPSVVDVPLDAAAVLNPGSGLLYTFVPQAATIDQSRPRATMPNAEPARILAGWEALAAWGLPYCAGEACAFRLRGRLATESFGLDVNLPRSMVERGFYPQWVADVGAFRRAVGWDDDDDATPALARAGTAPAAGRVAVYFDNSGLRQGRYTLDQWIRIGKASGMDGLCPQRVRLGGVTHLTSGAAVSH